MNIFGSDIEISETKYLELRQILVAYSLQYGTFTLASGAQSDVYLDVRKTALRADGASLIGDLFMQSFRGKGYQAIGGMTLGADPILTAITIASLRTSLPLHAIIIRKASKEHGTMNALEIAGGIPDGVEIAVLDDVVTSAGSTIKAIHALRKQGYEVKDAYCIVDREANGEKKLDEIGVRLYSLFQLSDLLSEKNI